MDGVFVFWVGEHPFGRVSESRDMSFSCLVSVFVMWGYSLVLVLLVGGWAIGHIFWARRWYPSMVLTTSFAALSTWSVVTFVGAEEVLDGKKSLLLGSPYVVVAELVEVYKGFGYR